MEAYGCQVFAFDPSMEIGDHQHSQRVTFFNLGLSDANREKDHRGWKVRNLLSIIKQLGHEKVSY